MNKRFTTIAATFAAASLMSVAATADDTPSDTQEWAQEAGVAINASMNYPRVARNHGKSGTASFKVTIDRDGDVVNYYSQKSTGTPALDNAAERALKLADFPAIPESFAGEQLSFSLEMTYRQKESTARQNYLDAKNRKGAVTGTRIALLGGVSLAAAK